MTDQALRASDREREHSVDALREHAAQGRLTMGEFEQRMGAAYAATTRGELRDLMRDLPETGPGEGPGTAATVNRHARDGSLQRTQAWLHQGRGWLAPALAVVLVAGIVVAVSYGSGGFPWPLFALFWVFCGGGCSAKRRHARSVHYRSRSHPSV